MRSELRAKLGLFVMGICLSPGASANVLGLFPAGNESKSAAIETAVDAEDPQALFYNPAGLSMSPQGFQGEIGIGRLEYSYEHPQFDPVRLSVLSPALSAGWTGRGDASFSWAVAVFPTSNADLKVNGLPRRIDGKQESLSLITTRKQLYMPAGGAWKYSHVPGIDTSVGVSLIATYDDRELTADSLVDGLRVVDMTSRGLFFRQVFGLYQNWQSFKLGVSYMDGLKKPYKGKTTIAGKAETDTQQVDYDPAVLATGARLEMLDWSASVLVNRIFAAKGRTVVRDGIDPKAVTADLRDVNHFGVRVGFRLSEDDVVSAAYAYLPSIWGAGHYSVNADGFSEHELGHLFGTFNAISVRNQSLSWKHGVEAMSFHTTLFRSAGKQSVDGDGDNPGFYQIEFVSLTTGLTQSF